MNKIRVPPRGLTFGALNGQLLHSPKMNHRIINIQNKSPIDITPPSHP